MRLFATKRPDGSPCTVGASLQDATGKAEVLEDWFWQDLVEKGWSVVPITLFEGHGTYALLQDMGRLPPLMPPDGEEPVSLTELPADDERRG